MEYLVNKNDVIYIYHSQKYQYTPVFPAECIVRVVREGYLKDFRAHKSKNSNGLQEIVEVVVESWRRIFKYMSLNFA